MKLFDTFERKFLFSLTRGVALLFICLLLAAVVIGSFFVSSQFQGETAKVSPSEVIEMIAPPPPPVQADESAKTPSTKSDQSLLPGIKIPFVLQKHFSTPENVKILNGWLKGLDPQGRQEFVDEMAATVVEAEKRQLSAVDAINKFREIKGQKLADAKVAAAAFEQRRLYYAAGAFGAILLVSLLSLILVLLAIERNTRRELDHGTAA